MTQWPKLCKSLCHKGVAGKILGKERILTTQTHLVRLAKVAEPSLNFQKKDFTYLGRKLINWV